MDDRRWGGCTFQNGKDHHHHHHQQQQQKQRVASHFAVVRRGGPRARLMLLLLVVGTCAVVGETVGTSLGLAKLCLSPSNRYDCHHELQRIQRRLISLRGGTAAADFVGDDDDDDGWENHRPRHEKQQRPPPSPQQQQQQQSPFRYNRPLDYPQQPWSAGTTRQGQQTQQQQQQQQGRQPYPQQQQQQQSSMAGAVEQQRAPPPLPPWGQESDVYSQQQSSPSLDGMDNGMSMSPPLLPGDDYVEDDVMMDHDDNDDWQKTSSLPNPHQPHHQPQDSAVDLSQFNKDVIFDGLKRMYRKKIMPLELSSKYGHFHSPPLSPSDFDAKPMVLLVGQYSVGKTSFIRYLLGRDFPGSRIGPEPTTDRFTAIMLAQEGGGGVDKIVPGAALCSQGDRPYRGLSAFGNQFLSRFEGIELVQGTASILQNVTLVDTPGILSGQKQQLGGRNYDYEQVMKWFAERADLIVVMFDAHKLDISDELKRVMELLTAHQDKVRIVLNKADTVSTQQLMRVYGALMWQLGKVMNTPEVCRVYMSSFWDRPFSNREQESLLHQERLDLLADIARLPQNAVMRRINELVKRARSVKVHAYIIHYLRKQLPYTWGKREKQRRLIGTLDREFVMAARRYELPRGDFPALEPFRQALLEIKDLSEFPKLDKKMVREMDRVFSEDIPALLEKARMST